MPPTTKEQMRYSCLMNSEAPCLSGASYLLDLVANFYNVEWALFHELESIEVFGGVATEVDGAQLCPVGECPEQASD